MTSGWRLNSGDEDPVEFMNAGHKVSAQIQSLPSGKYSIAIDSYSYTLTALQSDDHKIALMVHGNEIENQSAKAQVLLSGENIQVHSSSGTSQFQKAPRLTISNSEEDDDHGLHAPMNGCLTEVWVNAGDQVNAGDILVIMEAMKMEHSIKAPHDGFIAEVFFAEGDLVDEGAELLSFADSE